MGSDYLFSLADLRKTISETELSSDRNQSPEELEKLVGITKSKVQKYRMQSKGLFWLFFLWFLSWSFWVSASILAVRAAFCSVSDFMIWSRISRSLSTMTVSPPVCCTYYTGFRIEMGVYPLVRILRVRHFDMWRKFDHREGYWIVTER